MRVRSQVKGPASGTVRLRLPAGWTSRPASAAFSFAREGEEAELSLVAIPPEDLAAGSAFAIEAAAAYRGREYSEWLTAVEARDVGRAVLYRPARHVVRTARIAVAPGLRVAVIPGSGDEVAAALRFLGIAAETLGPEEIAAGDLSRYDTILVGVRAYAAREDICMHNARLLDFVRGGGTLIVQYQTPEFDHDFGPYPYRMTRSPEEVSEEDAPVTILEPEHPVLTWPNRITAADFDGWVEQRGSKFWKEWDGRYTPLLECHDTGQEPQRGGMLVARDGKGYYVYSAYAWYRQLPAGVPGAFRIVANMLSLGHRKTEAGGGR